jgi:hypothetical protein
MSTDTAPESNVRAAYAYLVETVRERPGPLTLGNRLQVCEMAVRRGPQVIEYYRDGLCFWCGQHPPISGYFTCETCSEMPEDDRV